MTRPFIALSALTLTFACVTSTAHAAEFSADFNDVNDRVWIGPDFWANPMEDFQVKDGRVECVRGGANRNVAVLSAAMSRPTAPFEMRIKVGVLKKGGAAGLRLGVTDQIDDYRAAALRGNGLDVGVTSSGVLYIGNVPDKSAGFEVFPDSGIELRLRGEPDGDKVKLTLSGHEVASGKQLSELTSTVPAERLAGLIAMTNNGVKGKGVNASGLCWFDDLHISGENVTLHRDRAWGPILWAMHTLHRTGGDEGHVMKMTAQMPPMGDKDPQTVKLQAKHGNDWQTLGEQKIDGLSCTATFRVPNWHAGKDTPYRLVYGDAEYAGTVRADPIDRTLVVAGFTGNTDTGFPNVEVATNVGKQNPDVLFFSGDQIYEGVGGYGIIREPVEPAVLNYLRKWYLLGWAFGDLMRDRPTLSLPDDHDVYQGNIWGAAGKAMDGRNTSTDEGYIEPPAFVNAVHRTQTGHHPDAYDPTPIKQDITVYYGPMTYGPVSFAVIADRMFKDGPENVSWWGGRKDHVKPNDPKDWDPKRADKPGLNLLGDRQQKFLNDWADDWTQGVYFKCVLSQTIFCNLANYHGGNQEFLIADLDSNGWPQTGRNDALRAMRKGFAFHYAGDQHLPSITHNGVDAWGDAGFAFCVPSIAAGYPRSWRPDAEGRPVQGREKTGGLANTGDYRDGFDNMITVYAIGNPEPKNRPGRINTLHDKASGHGIVRFHPDTQKIDIECYRLQIDADNLKPGDQFPGWPRTIHVTDNYGRKAVAHLPTIKVDGRTDPVIKVIDEKTGELVYALRIKGTEFRPKVFDADARYTVQVDEKSIKGVTAKDGVLEVSFQKLR